MANENCLKDMACPKCKSEGPFGMAVTAWCNDVSDDGTDGDFTEIEWPDDGLCRCKECLHMGLVRDFRTDREAEPPRAAPPGHIERAKKLLRCCGEYAAECRGSAAENADRGNSAAEFEASAEETDFIAELLQEYIDKWEVTNANRC